MIQLYRHPMSGHSHKVELFLNILGENFELINIDLKSKEQKSVDFLTLNFMGQVPVIKDENFTLADSNAILVYLAQKYDKTKTWFPESPELQAEVVRFLSLSAGKLVMGPAMARTAIVFGAPINHEKAIMISHELFEQLDQFLEGKKWFVNDTPTLADLAMYTYLKHAPEGKVEIDKYLNVNKWFLSVESIPGFINMQSSGLK
ncbi:glutathione S-transferase [Vibrio parahaemolyticus]|nr:glutathione S-transferase [Vibrio parahaemolyticus]HCM1323107.1 glutathione S-transferase N-terminal domain-containing protein [Vibrio parahaemolyticus]HCM1328049.1 glutathione S-transferase N-terminal domain-containing protein [Vibrio parahaemolyticus]